MKNKIYLSILILLITTIPAYAFTISKEIKAAALVFAKMSVGVVISAIIIYFGLLFYGKIKEKVNIKIKMPTNKNRQNPKNTEDFKCEIDDVNTMEEAINTFLKINN